MKKMLNFDEREETDPNLILRDRNEKEVYQAVRNGCVNVNGVIEDTGLSEPTVRVHINRLLKVGRLVRMTTTGPLTFKVSDVDNEPSEIDNSQSRMAKLESRISRIEKELEL